MSRLTPEERHIMEHALGSWSRTQKPGWRNHYCASPGEDHWGTLECLCARGLMMRKVNPSELTGGGTVFSVTMAGETALKEVAR